MDADIVLSSKLRRPSIRQLRVTCSPWRELSRKLLFMEIGHHRVRARHAARHGEIAGFANLRAFLTEAPGEISKIMVFSGLPGPFGGRFHDLQAKGSPQTHFPRPIGQLPISHAWWKNWRVRFAGVLDIGGSASHHRTRIGPSVED